MKTWATTKEAECVFLYVTGLPTPLTAGSSPLTPSLNDHCELQPEPERHESPPGDAESNRADPNPTTGDTTTCAAELPRRRRSPIPQGCWWLRMRKFLATCAPCHWLVRRLRESAERLRKKGLHRYHPLQCGDQVCNAALWARTGALVHVS